MRPGGGSRWLGRLKLLVLGGTAWLGQAIAAHGLDRGHQVTCLARGDSGAPPAGARFVRADRDRHDAYDGINGERWDAVIDVARQPGHVRRAVTALEPAAGRYVFVSSGSAHVSQRAPDQDEDATLLPPLASDVLESMEHYGQAKVACEQAVAAASGAERTTIARAGPVGGPGDWSGRPGYWPWRFARPSNPDGAVLIPDAPDLPTALIDVRDLPAWLLTCAENSVAGVFNANANRMPQAHNLTVARVVASHTGPMVSASPEWLLEHGVQSWSGPMSLPLWIDDVDLQGMNARDTHRARTAGRVTRPLHETLTDTLAWELSHPHPGPHGTPASSDKTAPQRVGGVSSRCNAVTDGPVPLMTAPQPHDGQLDALVSRADAVLAQHDSRQRWADRVSGCRRGGRRGGCGGPGSAGSSR